MNSDCYHTEKSWSLDLNWLFQCHQPVNFVTSQISATIARQLLINTYYNIHLKTTLLSEIISNFLWQIGTDFHSCRKESLLEQTLFFQISAPCKNLWPSQVQKNSSLFSFKIGRILALSWLGYKLRCVIMSGTHFLKSSTQRLQQLVEFLVWNEWTFLNLFYKGGVNGKIE